MKQDQSRNQLINLQELSVPLCTIITVHNIVAQTVLLILQFLQTNITSQMWPDVHLDFS